MMMFAETVVMALGVYFAIGAVVALIFLTFFVHRLDEAAKGASLFFRPAIFLGCVALWPFISLRILSMRKINQPIEDEQ
ncbi:MAG: hypothetical protein KJN99_13590 [Marinicaulis sp.]|nr:hypothetical protein [Marinicaulis sp.]